MISQFTDFKTRKIKALSSKFQTGLKNVHRTELQISEREFSGLDSSYDIIHILPAAGHLPVITRIDAERA